MSEKVVPTHAQGIFVVHKDGLVTQLVIFDYYDPERYYATLEERGELEDELATIASNMQQFLDEEEVIINGKRTRPVVKLIDLNYRGLKTRPYIFFIIEFRGEFRKGKNVYENKYESEIVQYDYEVYWIFPENMKVIDVELEGDIQVLNERKIVAKVTRGTKVKGYEKITFEIT